MSTVSFRIVGSLLWLSLLVPLTRAQEIRVGPVLQNATPHSIWIMWETTSGSAGLAEFGITEDLGQTAASSSQASVGDARIHHAELSGLMPDTVYHYRVRTGRAVSEIHAFRTPAEASEEFSFRFAALSDTQGGPVSDMHTQTINDGIIRFVQDQFGPNLYDKLDFVIQPGDLVTTGTDYQQWKDQYFDETHNLYRHVPIYPVPGNHEQDSHWFFDYFHLPHNGTPGFEEHWWFKDHGNIRLIGCDSNSGYRNQQQLDWLQGVLDDAATIDTIDFVFVQLHHPHLSGIWTPGNTDYTGEIVEMMGEFSTATGKPSLHFFGHTHAYERGQSKDHNHLYVNVAAGEGAIDYWDQSDIDYDEFQRVYPEWGFVIMDVVAGDDPKFRLRRINRGNDYITRENEVMDDITIRRHNGAPAAPAPVSPSPMAKQIDPDAAVLEASGFSDPDGDMHLESEFQLTTVSGDYSQARSEWIRFENWAAPPDATGPANGYYSVNTVDDPDITRVRLNMLEGDTGYFWRVRYRDANLGWSDWSQESSFTTGPAPLGACCYLTAVCQEMREQTCLADGGRWLGLNTDCDDCAETIIAYSENFDAVDLGPPVDEGGEGDVWSESPPAGWNIDRSAMPGGGVSEWRGWSMADADWWASIAGQGRNRFAAASGATAIADPDEWDDAPRQDGTFNSWLESPTIDVSGIEPGTAKLAFNSSWRPEGEQRALITASFDGGPEIILADWRSSGDSFKPEAIDETAVIDLNFPPGVRSVELRFGLLDARNNWWWAIDNILIAGEPADHRVTLIEESFEAVDLGPSVDEPPAPGVWTDTPPEGWTLDDSGVPSVGIPTQGVTEWEGWAFADVQWWTTIADDQRRSEFTLGRGTVAIADPDEWDDLGDPEALGPYDAFLSSSAIDISAVRRGSVKLSLDSSWRPEDNQRARLRTSFDGGDWANLLEWTSQPGGSFHADATNERLLLSVQNPPGASSMMLEFAVLDAGNDWWWAIDNIRMTGICAAEFAPPDDVLNFFDISAFLLDFDALADNADLNGDESLNFFDVQLFLQAFLNGC